MKTPLPLYPFDPELCIGTIIEVGPTTARANLPRAAEPDAMWRYGVQHSRGEVGDFVVVELDDAAVFGRIIGVRLPERDRLAVEPELGSRAETHPVGTIQLLSTIGLQFGIVEGGLREFPRLGSRVYAIHPSLITWIAEAAYKDDREQPTRVIRLGTVPSASDMTVQVVPERLFGRHCAVLGATGGGKSWTLARLMEEAARFKGAKIVLLDATGEFHTLGELALHVQIGPGPANPTSCKECAFPYTSLTEGDLFAMFRPSGQVQVPKLRNAIKSLKLVKLEPAVASAGLLIRMQKQKNPIDTLFVRHARSLEQPAADFDMNFLVVQIQEECVYPSGGSFNNPDYLRWGNYNESDKSYCTSLLGRIEEICSSTELACLFQSSGKSSLIDEIDQFIQDPKGRILRISLKHLGFAHNAREIVANAIGRHLLGLARQQKFRERPLIVFLDEAHQFVDKALGDENTRYALDAFDLIAKEGRKYALSICISTQRPRDIPEGVLSQMGTLIVHRLTNDRDREVVERASGDIDRSAAAFLPTLAPGQAVIIGVDFPVPLTLQMLAPAAPPDSQGPNFQRSWTLE